MQIHQDVIYTSAIFMFCWTWVVIYPYNMIQQDTLFIVFSLYLLTYSMVQSPSWAADWFAASQEIPRISRNPKVHYRTHKRPPPVSILGQPNPVHIPTSHLLLSKKGTNHHQALLQFKVLKYICTFYIVVTRSACCWFVRTETCSILLYDIEFFYLTVYFVR